MHDQHVIEKITLDDAFESIDEQWSPRIAAELNGQAVKLSTVEGKFVWHHHEDADELFMIVSGTLRIEFREQPNIELEAGELVVVPRGVEHRPVAAEETRILLFEPTGIENTGNTVSDLTAEEEHLE